MSNEIVDALGKVASQEVSITAQMIADARKKGTSYVCAHCEHFWQGILRKLDRCVAMAEGRKCGSVFVGMAFPEYRGPLSRDNFPTFCFVCGASADAGVHAGESGMLGVCETHLKWVRDAKALQDKKKIQDQIQGG